MDPMWNDHNNLLVILLQTLSPQEKNNTHEVDGNLV